MTEIPPVTDIPLVNSKEEAEAPVHVTQDMDASLPSGPLVTAPSISDIAAVTTNNDGSERKETDVATPDTSRKRDRKRTKMFEITAPVTPPSRRREHKSGNGIPLGEIPNVSFLLNSIKGRDDELVLLHRLLYSTPGVAIKRKQVIREFRGFAFDTDKERERIKQRLSKEPLALIRKVAQLLDLPHSSVTKSVLIDAVTTFLEHPQPGEDRVDLAAKAQKRRDERARQRERKGKATVGRSTKEGSSKGKKRKHSASDSESSSDFDEDEDHLTIPVTSHTAGLSPKTPGPSSRGTPQPRVERNYFQLTDGKIIDDQKNNQDQAGNSADDENGIGNHLKDRHRLHTATQSKAQGKPPNKVISRSRQNSNAHASETGSANTVQDTSKLNPKRLKYNMNKNVIGTAGKSGVQAPSLSSDDDSEAASGQVASSPKETAEIGQDPKQASTLDGDENIDEEEEGLPSLIDLETAIEKLLAVGNVDSLTVRSVRTSLEQQFGCSLTNRMSFLRRTIAKKLES